MWAVDTVNRTVVVGLAYTQAPIVEVTCANQLMQYPLPYNCSGSPSIAKGQWMGLPVSCTAGMDSFAMLVTAVLQEARHTEAYSCV